MRLEMQIKKAEAAQAELRFKIGERDRDIKRMKDHIAQQEEIKAELSQKLREL